MKKLRNKWFLPLFCAALLATGACSEDDTESGTREPLPPTLTTENIPDGGFSFLYSAQEPQTFLLSTDAPWEITKTSGWFVVSPKEGEAGQGIEITVLADQNEGEERTGEFTIRANSGNNLHPVYTEYTVELRQDAFRAAGITVEGLTEDVLTFAAEESAATTLYVTASYDWNITLSDDSWVGISPMNGTASERTAVKVTPKPSTDGKRHEATMTITATDPIYPENTATREIALVQMPPSDSHPEGTAFWQDDFGWVTENWVEPYTKYGWPSVAIDGKNNNEFALSTDGMASAAAEKGYNYSPSVYARYEGHLKLGKTANMGSITTPSLSDIDAGKNATLLVQFDAAAYSSAGGSVDNGDTHFYVSVTPPATIGGMEESEVGIEVTNVWSWTRYSVLVYGATAETKITFGSERAVKCRLYLDNISISRAADEGAEAPDPQPVETPLDKEIVDNSPAGTYNSSNEVSKDGATLLYSVRVNKAWSAESDCDWLTITAVRCGSTGTGADNGASLSGGIATVSATGLPYNQTLFAAAENKTTEARTGHILIKVNGETIETVTVKQEAGAPASFDIQGLNDNAVTLAADPASSEASVTFTVTGTHDWKASVPSGETWYTVSPLEGAAGQAVEVTVSAVEKNEGAARNGSFTLTMTPEGLEPLTETITVTQNGPEQMWDLAAPVQWNFSAENMPNYQDFFNGKANNPASKNALPADQGPGYISFTHNYEGLPDVCERQVGSTGHPYVTGVWPGDYWSFRVPVASLAAGSKIRFSGITRTSKTGHKYWKLVYNDGGEWKPASTLLNKEVNGETVEYTHAMAGDGSTNIEVDATVTFSNAIDNGNIEFRFICMANAQSSNETPLSAPNTGTSRWAGAGTADSPRIEAVQ